MRENFLCQVKRRQKRIINRAVWKIVSPGGGDPMAGNFCGYWFLSKIAFDDGRYFFFRQLDAWEKSV